MKLRLSNRSDWKRIVDYVKTLQWVRDGKQVIYRITIEELKPTRSLEQNSRYWAILTDISQKAPEFMLGEYHDPETWHHYCAKRFLGVEATIFGDPVPKSTKRLSVGEFSEYMEKIEAWAVSELGIAFDYREAA